MIVCLCLDDREGLFSTTAAKAGTGLSSRTWGKRWARAGCGPSLFAAPLAGWEGDLRADENFLNLAGPGEYCFAEGQLLAPYREEAGVPGAVPLEPPVPRGCLL